MIDGLPVLVVDELWLDVDYIHHYRHNGLDVVKFHLPENIAFRGLAKIGTGMGSVFVPNFTEEYYPRQKSLLRKDEGAYHFFAEKTDNESCSIFAIICDNAIKKEWVWSTETHKPVGVERLVVPAEISGYKVQKVLCDSTRALPENIIEIHIEEGLEIIEESCFSALPYLTDVYLPKSMKNIQSGAFGYYEKNEYTKKVPTLNVHYIDKMPVIEEGAFIRGADREEYEEYSDWGNMYVGSTRLNYEVIYQQEK